MHIGAYMYTCTVHLNSGERMVILQIKGLKYLRILGHWLGFKRNHQVIMVPLSAK